MAIIKPFKGIRPPQDLVEQVASRPYDVLNSAEARAEAEGNEKSLYHIIKPEIDFPVGTDEHDDRTILHSLPKLFGIFSFHVDHELHCHGSSNPNQQFIFMHTWENPAKCHLEI